MIPNFAVVGVETREWRIPRIWFPLFLLWIPVVFFAPVIFLLLVVIAVACRTTIWRLMAMFWNFLSALRGTDVRVRAEGSDVVVRIF